MGQFRLLFSMCLILFSTWMGINLRAQSYDNLWKQTREAQAKNRPMTMIDLNDQIYRRALAEKNMAQMLKAYVSREAYERFLTPDSLYSTLNDLERWVERSTDKVEKALLHSLLAYEYADYWEKNLYRIQERADIVTEKPSADIRTWSSGRFVEQVTAHGLASLANDDLLVEMVTSDYQPFIEQNDGSAYYGHDLYHLLFHRTINAFEKMSGTYADSLFQSLSDSLYHRMLDVYTHLPNRPEAIILATLDYWQWKTGNYLNRAPQLRPYDRNRELENSYMQMIDGLMEKYADCPAIVEAYICKAKWMSHGGKGRSIAEALRLCDEGIRNYPSYNRIGELRLIRDRLLQPQVSIRSNDFCYPGDTLKLNVTYRTLNTPIQLNIYATNATMHSYRYDCNDDEEFRKCAPRLVYSTKHLLTPLPAFDKLPADIPYLPSDTVLNFPLPSEPGIYVVEASPQTENGHMSRCFLSVSRLRMFTLDIGNGVIEVTTLDNRSGHPISDVTVDFYTGEDPTSLKPLKSVATGTDGKALVDLGKGIRTIHYVAHKGNDRSIQIQRLDLAQVASQVPETDYKLVLFTDRAIYRPGQTVCLKGVAYSQNGDKAEVICKEPIELELLDSTDGLIAARKVVTNDFGSFSAEFTLPAICLNGKFSLSAQGKAEVTVRFHVEDYKRPTFEIVFQPITFPYRLGETVTVSGQVKNFSGVALQKRPLAYRVIRHNPIIFHRSPQKEVLATDTISLDSEGRFSIPVKLDTLRLEPFMLELFNLSQLSCHYTYEIEAAVTDDSGETRTASYNLFAGRKALELDVFCPSLICKEDTDGWMLRAYNEESVCQTLYADWRIDRTPLEQQIQANPPLLSGTCRTDSLQPYALWKSLPSGGYRLTITAIDSLGHQAETYQDFVWFSRQDVRPPLHTPLFFYEGRTEVGVGEQASFYVGTSYKDAYLLMDVFTGEKRMDSRVLHLSDTLMYVKMPYLETYGESVTVQFALLREGQRYDESVLLKRKQPDMRLNLKWQVFRDHLRPLQDEEWKLVVSHPDGLPASAEVLAFMYDASLDDFYRWYPRWNVLFRRDWNERGRYVSSQTNLRLSPGYTLPDRQVPVLRYDHFFSPTVHSWVSIEKSKDKGYTIVVTGFPSPRSATLVQSVRAGKREGIVYEPWSDDEEPGRGNTLRTDFSETAFFYPNLRTNERGEVEIAFTTPESLTRWNFRCYAHTREMRTATLETSVVTAKEFMVRPGLPRFLRVGDCASIPATVSNLTPKAVKGNVWLQLFDPLTEKVVRTCKQRFKVECGGHTTVCFNFEVDGQYDLLGIRLTADSKNFSDGEQHLLPVLSDKKWLKESLPFDLQGNDTCMLRIDTLFNHDSHLATHRRLTVEVAGNPAWLAIQALPTWAEPAYEDAISWALAYYANTLAKSIVVSQPRIMSVLEAWQISDASEELVQSRLFQNQELKNMPIFETPWLSDSSRETDRMQGLARLLDVNRQRNLQRVALARLGELQNEEGAWSWYKGMGSDRFVTTFITTLLVRLPLLTGMPLDEDALWMKQRALDFLQKKAQKESEQRSGRYSAVPFSDYTLHYLYLLALESTPLPATCQPMFKDFLEQLPRLLNAGTIQAKAQAAIVLLVNGYRSDATDFMTSLKEHLTHDPRMGTHFAFNDHRYGWGMVPIPEHVATIEALARFDGNEALIEEMKRWLLKQKQTVLWNNSVASAEAVYALLCTGRNWLADRGEVQISLDNKPISTIWSTLQNHPLQGLGYIKETFAEDDAVWKAQTMTVAKRDSGMAWGAVYAQYLLPITAARRQGGELDIEKQLYVQRQDASGRSVLYPIAGNTSLRVGDKVVTRLILRLERAMDYIQLEDYRASCLEPISVLSGFHGNRSLDYYVDTKDVSTRFFMDHLGKGVYVLEYSCYVTRSGVYQCGLATAQCAYAPELTAHTKGGLEIKIEETSSHTAISAPRNTTFSRCKHREVIPKQLE